MSTNIPTPVIDVMAFVPGRAELTRDHGRSHNSHRMAWQNRSGKSEPLNEPNDIACVGLDPPVLK
jgi:hypothetical protein